MLRSPTEINNRESDRDFRSWLIRVSSSGVDFRRCVRVAHCEAGRGEEESGGVEMLNDMGPRNLQCGGCEKQCGNDEEEHRGSGLTITLRELDDRRSSEPQRDRPERGEQRKVASNSSRTSTPSAC